MEQETEKFFQTIILKVLKTWGKIVVLVLNNEIGKFLVSKVQ